MTPANQYILQTLRPDYALDRNWGVLASELRVKVFQKELEAERVCRSRNLSCAAAFNLSRWLQALCGALARQPFDFHSAFREM